MLQGLNIAVLSFAGTDVVRGSEERAQETVDFIVADMRHRRRYAAAMAAWPVLGSSLQKLGSFAILPAIRRTTSRVSSLAAESPFTFRACRVSSR